MEAGRQPAQGSVAVYDISRRHEGLQGLDFHHKWGPQEVNVPKAFEARFLRIRLHNDGQGVTAFHFPSELHVFANVTEGIWAFPKTGPTLLQGKLMHTVPAKSSNAVEIGDGRTLAPGAYLLAVRTKAAGHGEDHA
jgi:hypothetical protein